MKPLSVMIAGALIVISSGLAWGDDAASAAGFWVTQNHGGVVNIVPCQDALCGFIVGLRTDHPPGAIVFDAKNPDPAKRAKPMCGLPLMGSLKAANSNAGKWSGGWVYDPESGNTYKAEMQLSGPNVLKLRGYLGISLFGRTETWMRESGDSKNRCAESKAEANGSAPDAAPPRS